MYESTMLGLVHLYPKLSIGGHLIVDDYFAIPACRQAVDDFRQERGIAEPLVCMDGLGVSWKRDDCAVNARIPEVSNDETEVGAAGARGKSAQVVPDSLAVANYDLYKLIDVQRHSIRQLTSELEGADREVRSLREHLEAKCAEVDNLQEFVCKHTAESERYVASLREQIETMESELSTMREALVSEPRQTASSETD